jgi:hypothetical protein
MIFINLKIMYLPLCVHILNNMYTYTQKWLQNFFEKTWKKFDFYKFKNKAFAFMCIYYSEYIHIYAKVITILKLLCVYILFFSKIY